MKKVATFGEILLRLATPNKERILQAKNFDVDYSTLSVVISGTL